MSEIQHQSELMALAGQIYVRMRRCNGRVVDALYMVKNPDYAREILDLALRQQDSELQMLAARYERFLEPEPDLPVLTPEPLLAEPEILTESVSPVLSPASAVTPADEEVALHYVGALR